MSAERNEPTSRKVLVLPALPSCTPNSIVPALRAGNDRIDDEVGGRADQPAERQRDHQPDRDGDEIPRIRKFRKSLSTTASNRVSSGGGVAVGLRC